jgi:PilZ domain
MARRKWSRCAIEGPAPNVYSLYAMAASFYNEERRASRRFDLRLPLVVRFHRSAAWSEIHTESGDVSSRGIYFSFPTELHPGASLEIVMTLPQEITLAGPAKVRCAGTVVRMDTRAGQRGVAARIHRFEFLRDAVSSLHF